MDIMKMSAQEIYLLSIFANLAKEAVEAEQLIKTHFNTAFGFDNRTIRVYDRGTCDECYGEGYLTIDGTFEYHDFCGGHNFKFECTADSIYRMLRSCYLRKHKIQDLETDKFDCEIEHIDCYFRDFISEIKSK